MERMKWCLQWLRRCGHGRGFGIQSPSAYQFVTEVVCQRSPYHVYEDMDQRHPNLKGRQLKLCRLLLRLANHQQAARSYVDGSLPAAYKDFLLAGHRHTTWMEAPEVCGLMVLSAADSNVVQHVADSAADGVMLVLTDIYRQGRMSEVWRQIRSHRRVGMAIDAYDCGIVLFGHALHRQYYRVNL